MTTVYFATNRLPDGQGGYSSNVAPYDINDITFAAAEVSGIDLTKESSGTIDSIRSKSPANFPANLRDEIVATRKNLLVFIHGFDNSFEDAIKRAAFNREWFAATKVPQADTTVVAFTWPSGGELFAAPPHLPPDAYFEDQSRAAQSAFHIAYFMRVIDQLRGSYRAANPTGRIILLSHSMGNYALAGAVQLWFTSSDPNEQIFDEAILPAADEIDDSFLRPANGRLSDLPRLAKRITTYSSEIDVAMYLSTTFNLSSRLGFDGPDRKDNAALYPADIYRIVDVTDVNDYSIIDPPDATHQYYRRSDVVRRDIVSLMANSPGVHGGVQKLSGGPPRATRS